MITEDFIPYGRQSIDSSDVLAVSEAMAGKIITRGVHVEAFEDNIAKYCGAEFGVAFNSATSALMAACHVAELGAHDRVITTPNTFVASVGAAIHCGATPVFVDIDRSTGNCNLEQIEHNINHPLSRGKNVFIPVHFSGIAVDMAETYALIRNPDTIVIEDAAHALGSTYPDGKRVGCCAWSHMTVFSFHPVKTITSGEGGMVTTNDPDLYHRLKRYRNNGIERDPKHMEDNPGPWFYEVQEITGNYNFTEIQAALGLSQLKRLNKFVEKRRKLMGIYREAFKDSPYIRMLSSDFDKDTAYHLCVVQINFDAYGKEKKEVMDQLQDRGIGSQVHYIPVYRHPVFTKKMGDVASYFPQMEAYYQQALTLPLFYDLKEETVPRIVGALLEILSSRK
jgi:UDP-4-amino-4,6-dideoxy-N-acetyl-beta-L-altrosamine transaminase